MQRPHLNSIWVNHRNTMHLTHLRLCLEFDLPIKHYKTIVIMIIINMIVVFIILILEDWHPSHNNYIILFGYHQCTNKYNIFWLVWFVFILSNIYQSINYYCNLMVYYKCDLFNVLIIFFQTQERQLQNRGATKKYFIVPIL